MSAAPDQTGDTTVVFLHIPKTAGQTIHAELTRVVGAGAVSPVRVHTQAGPGTAQLPPGYRLYSGHIDWDALETLPAPRFVFTVLRDPLERIASFYFYLRRQAEGLSAEDLASPARTGMRLALERSPDDYFFGGDGAWKRFILDHYHSPYCCYLATRRIRGWGQASQWSRRELLQRALEAAQGLDGIYSVDDLGRLERDLETRIGVRIDITGRFVNAAPDGRDTARWPRLVEMTERAETVEKLMDFARADQMLMFRLGLGPKPEPARGGGEAG